MKKKQKKLPETAWSKVEDIIWTVLIFGGMIFLAWGFLSVAKAGCRLAPGM